MGATGQPLPPGQRRARLALCHQVAEEEGNLTDAARRCHITTSAMHHWLRRNAPELRARLGDAGMHHRGPAMGRDKALERLRACSSFGVPAAAKAEGVPPEVVYSWLRRNFPGGRERWLAEITGKV